MTEMIKYDHSKVEKILKDKYHERTGKYVGGYQLENLIACIDDAFLDEWRRGILDEDKRLQTQANEVFQKAQKTIEQLDASVDAAKDSEIHDSRVVDALKAYTMIVDMDFDTPQQRLQNIKNASYFIWALYAGASDAANIFLKDIETTTSVKDEPDTQRSNGEWHTVSSAEKDRRI